MSLAAATKWTGVYGLGGMLLFLVAVAAWQRLPRHAGRPRALLPWSVVVWGVVGIPVVALTVYVLLYVPWAFLAGGDPQLFAGWPRGHTGELFLDLQARMFAFHDGLREGHPSGSPWWSWPLMLKPLWAYLEGFGDLVGSIVMPANPIVVWASGPVVLWAAWRLVRDGLNPALLLLVIAFAAQWLPWVRVERVAFFYHYATALPFALMLLALLLARVREHISPRGWRALRVAAITVAFVPAVAWAATGPLCSTLAADPGAGVCGAGWSWTCRSRSAWGWRRSCSPWHWSAGGCWRGGRRRMPRMARPADGTWWRRPWASRWCWASRWRASPWAAPGCCRRGFSRSRRRW